MFAHTSSFGCRWRFLFIAGRGKSNMGSGRIGMGVDGVSAEAEASLRQCLRRLSFWRAPPNWSRTDWLAETQAIASAALCEALMDFDPSRGIPLGAFLYQRLLARAYTRYRQEWAYACRFGSPMEAFEDSETAEHSAARFGTQWPTATEPPSARREWLREALAELPTTQRRLLEYLFWERRTVMEVAESSGVTHQAISKRKHAALNELRRCLEMNA